MKSRVLLTGPVSTPEVLDDTPLPEYDQDTNFVPEPLNPEVLEKIADGEFDGVICQADGLDALDCVSKIRTKNVRVPIVLVSSRPDPDFERCALSSGATTVVPGNLHAAIVAENVARTLKLKLAAREMEEHGKVADRLRQELREAVLERKAITQQGGHVSRHWQKRGLLPLLVENDPDQAFQMVKAFDHAGIYAPLPIMKSPEEAIQYLQGTGPYENRNVNPLPNAVLLALSPSSLGVELLRWLRSQPDLAAIPVIVLSSVALPAAIREAYDNMANSFLVKSGNPAELVALLRSIDLYWSRMNIGRAY